MESEFVLVKVNIYHKRNMLYVCIYIYKIIIELRARGELNVLMMALMAMLCAVRYVRMKIFPWFIFDLLLH